jgi:hypothetical protein
MIEEEKSQDKGLDHSQDLRNNQDYIAVPAVDQHPGERSQQKSRDLAGKANQTQQECGIGHTVNQPGECNPLHPCPDERDALAHEKKPVIPIPQ